MLANVFCRGALSLGMRAFLNRSAAMLGQNRAFIQRGGVADLGRSLPSTLLGIKLGPYLGHTPAVKLRIVVK
jgi:hypothetical protein